MPSSYMSKLFVFALVAHSLLAVTAARDDAVENVLRVRRIALQGDIPLSAPFTGPFLMSGVSSNDTVLYFASGLSLLRGDPTSAVYSIHNFTSGASTARVARMRAGTGAASGPRTMLNYATGEPGRRVSAVYGTIVSPGSTDAMGFAGGAVAADEHISGRFCLVDDAWAYDAAADQYVVISPDARTKRPLRGARPDICQLDAPDDTGASRMPSIPLYTWFDRSRGDTWVLGGLGCRSKAHATRGVRACDSEHSWESTLEVWRYAGASERPTWHRMARTTAEIPDLATNLLAVVASDRASRTDTIPFVLVSRDGTAWEFVGTGDRGQWLPLATSCNPEALSLFAQSRSRISTDTGEVWAVGLLGARDRQCAELCRLRIDAQEGACNVQCYVDTQVSACPAATRAMWVGDNAVWMLAHSDGASPVLLEYRIEPRGTTTVVDEPAADETATTTTTTATENVNNAHNDETGDSGVSSEQNIARADVVESGILAVIIVVPIGGAILAALLAIGFSYLHHARPVYRYSD